MKNKQKQLKIKGKKQVDALKSLKPKEVKPEEIKPVEYGDYFLNRLAEIKSSPKIDFNNLKYTYKDPNNNLMDFIGFKGPLHIFKSIYNGNITLEDLEKDQIKLKSDLGHIRHGNPKNSSEEENNVVNNVTNLYESREKIVQMFNAYSKNMSRNIYESK